MERDKSIDIAKGIGIITVVWAHLQDACPIKEEIYLFHMPLFFILSGYFSSYKGNELINSIKKKFSSYITPYGIFFIIGLSLFILLYVLTDRSESIHIYPSIIVHPYGVVRPLWFLISIFQVSVIYILINHFFFNNKIKNLIIILLFICGALLSIFEIHLPLFIDASLSMILFFHMGHLLNKYSIFNMPTKNKTIISVIGLCFYILAIVLDQRVDIMVNNLSSNIILFILSSSGISFAIIFISQFLEKNATLSIFFSYLGKNSLSIFALHILCFEIARTIGNLPSLEDSNYMDGVYLTILGIIGSLILGYPIKKYILPFVTIKREKRKKGLLSPSKSL